MGTGLKLAATTLLKNASLKTGIGKDVFFSVYPYMFNPEQLRFLMDALIEVADVKGACVEAGCAGGATTALLRKWMDCQGIHKRYYAIDTFSGFVPQHVNYEIEHRNKPATLRGFFGANRKPWFDASMKSAGVDDVISIEADIAEFDFSRIAPVSFCLLDVDLYIPIAAALPEIYESLAEGGMIVCDDCSANNIYDGALQAYTEFVADKNLVSEIVFGKLGIIRK